MESSANDTVTGSRTYLWCVPRVVSTALAKCLAFIEGMEVWFEPFMPPYIARVEYKLHCNDDIPMEFEGNEDIFKKAKEFVDNFLMCRCEADRLSYDLVKHRLEKTTSKHVFVKDMSLTVTDRYREFLPRGFKHTFLIRNPVRTIHSYRKSMLAQLSAAGQLDSLGKTEETFDLEHDDRFFLPGCFVKEQYDLWVYVKENFDSNPVVIDADDLLTNPKETLSAYCAAVGLPYNDSLLQWDASVDAVIKMKAGTDDLLKNAIAFYGKAMKSSQFLAPTLQPPRDQLTPDVIRCSERVMEYYEEMFQSRLTV